MIRWAVSRPAVIWAIAAAVLVGGGVSFTRLAFATRTSVELPRLSVDASWSGVTAELTEMYLTAPIEAAVQGVRGVRRTTSESGEGTSSVTVHLDPAADVQLARLSVLERIEALRADSAFPPSVRPTVTNFVPDELREQPLLVYTVHGPYTPGALQRIVADQVVPRLASVPGVGAVTSTRGITFGVAIEYDEPTLRQIGIAPEVVSGAVSGARAVAALGEERLGASVRRVVLRDEPGAVEALAALPVRAASGRIFRLGELATIVPEEDAEGTFARVDGRPAVTLTVSREPSADALRTAAGVRSALTQLSGTLPPGLGFSLVGDDSVRLREQLVDLWRRGAIALVAVLVVLALAMRDARAVGFVMATAILAIAGTALGLFVLDIPANLLTLAGLGMGIGVLVQNGLIVAERLGRVSRHPDARAEAARQIAPAVIGATLTTGVVLLPFIYLQGDARAAFMPFAAAFALALGWSVVASVVMLPAIGTIGTAARPRGPRWRRLRRGYGRVVAVILRWRWPVLIAATGAVAALGWGFQARVPRFSWSAGWAQRSYIIVGLSFPRGSEPQAVDRTMREFEAIVVGRPGVERVRTQGSRTRASMRVEFTDAAELSSEPLVLLDELTQRGVLIGGANVSVSGFGNAFSSGGAVGSGSSFRIRVLGYSYAGVSGIAGDLRDRLAEIPRVREIRITSAGFSGSERSYAATLTPDRAALARYGLTTADFAAALRREVSQGGGGGRVPLEIGGEEMFVRVRARGVSHRTLDELREVRIPNPRGIPVRIADVAAIGEQEGLGTITRDDQQYVRVVGYDFRGPPRLAQRTHAAFVSTITVPPGFEVIDETVNWRAPDGSSRGLWLVFALGVALVVLTVAIVFDSAWAAGMVLVSLPLALAGVAAAFWLSSATFTREAAVGVILVVGLAVNQAILLVDGTLAAARRRALAGGEDRRRIRPADIHRAAMDRAGMIMLVTLAALASLLPLAIGTRVTDLFGAIALATAGGTVAGTVGALLVLPAVQAVGRGRGRAMGWRPLEIVIRDA